MLTPCRIADWVYDLTTGNHEDPHDFPPDELVEEIEAWEGPLSPGERLLVGLAHARECREYGRAEVDLECYARSFDPYESFVPYEPPEVW